LTAAVYSTVLQRYGGAVRRMQNTYRQAYCHAVEETAAASYSALKLDSGGTRTKSPTGLSCY